MLICRSNPFSLLTDSLYIPMKAASQILGSIPAKALVVLCSFLVLASVGIPEKALAAPGKESVSSTKKSRRMDEGEPVGIALSVESAASEVRIPDKSRPSAKTPEGAKAEPDRGPCIRQAHAARHRHNHKKINRRVSLSAAKKTPPIQPAPVADSSASSQDLSAALASYDAILKKRKNDPAALEGKVRALDQMGTDEALDKLDDLAEKHPSLASAQAARARILTRQKDTVVASEAWQQAVALDPGNKDYKLSQAALADQMGRGEEAFKFYKAIPGSLPPAAQSRFKSLAAQYGN